MRKTLWTIFLPTIILVTFIIYIGYTYTSETFYQNTTPTIQREEPPETTILFFVGDIMLSRAVGERMTQEKDHTWPFIKISPYLSNADILFGNLENPISERGTKVGSIYSFRADPKSIEGLSLAGFDALSIANNHIGDYSRIAAEDTINLLESSGIHAVGGGLDQEEAHRAKIIEHEGVRFGFLGYTLLGPEYIYATDSKAGITTPTISHMLDDIEQTKETSDTIIVSLHFGEEYETEANTYQKNLARKLIDAGAKIIIGHHPHVLQPGEFYKDGYIAYSLGNFVFDQHFSENVQTSAILEIVMEGDEIISVQETPIRITKDYQVILEPKL